MARSINLSTPRVAAWSWRKVARQVGFYVILLVIWQLLSQSGLWVSYLLPGPGDVVSRLITGFGDGSFLLAILTSLRRLAIGYGISLVLGVVMGMLIGRNRYVEETLGSLVLGLQALPSVCWIPLALLWLGLSEQAMTFVVVMGALFSITLGVDAGVKNTPPVYLKAARNMGAQGLALSTQVILPAALPAVISGLKQGWSFAWRSLMAAELIYQTLSLGTLLQNGRDLNDTAQVFAIMLIIIVVGTLIDLLIFSPLERNVRERWGFNNN
jgi:NitT/TauT family transport system permease protein